MKRQILTLASLTILSAVGLTQMSTVHAAETQKQNTYHKIKGSLAAFGIDYKVTAATPINSTVQTYTIHGIKSKSLPQNTRWNVVGEQLVQKNDVRYDLGGGYWVKSDQVTISESPQISKNFSSGIYVTGPNGATVQSEIGAVNGTRYLKNGSAWKYYKKVVLFPNIWYNLGGNQWVTSFSSME